MSESAPSPHEAMMQLVTGMWHAKAIGVVAELGVADHVTADGVSADALADAVGAHPASLRRLLRALATIGVFAERAPGVFALTPMSAVLQTDAPGSIRGFAIAQTTPGHWLPWGRLRDAIETGQSQAAAALGGLEMWDYYAQNPDEAKAFNRAMTDLSSAQIGPLVASYDFSGFGTIVDVGGGRGHLLDAILGSAPNARGILFDLPHVIEAIDVGELSHGDRVEVAGGSFFERVPEGGDAYVLKHIVHDWNDDKAEAILRTVRAAMGGDARLLVCEMVLADAAPPFAAWLDVHMMTLLDGMERTPDEFAAVLARAGFRMERVVQTGGQCQIVEGVPA